jgi:hypothetical protein|tara:strand:- start:79 stop:549 length:471 start_codon:yes stop_codon:yes gene_type:complete
MVNTGTYDGGTIMFWIVLCLMAPIALTMLASVMGAVVGCFEAFTPLLEAILIASKQVSTQREKVVYRDREKIVYRDRVKPQKTTASTTPIVSTPPPLPTISTPATDSQIISEATKALKVLGFGANDIKRAIKDLCSSKVYPDAESLLGDCLRQLND